MAAWPLLRDFLPHTSEIDWCETNYVHSSYIAEFYNTVSNVVYLVMPPLLIYLFGPYSRLIGSGINVVWLLIMVVGLGSIYFHATLSFAGQLIDEIAIAWVLLAAFTIWMPSRILARWPFRGDRRMLGCFMALIGVMALVLAFIKPIVNSFILISASIPAAILLVTEMKICKDRRAWRLCYVSLVWLTLAVLCWLSDRMHCSFWRSLGFPHLHSLWHVFMFLASYIACVLCAYLYALQEAPALRPQISFWPWEGFEHGVPYVRVSAEAREHCP